MAYDRKYLCPFCQNKIPKSKLATHLSRNHSDKLPEGFTALQTAYHIINSRPLEYTRKCRVCGRPTQWDENKGRYNFLCGDPKCDKIWVDKMKSTMGNKYGAYRPTSTPEGLKKMLAGRKISGTYKFQDGHEFTYTGSYELETLKFLDLVLNVKSEDLQVPGPVLNYEFQGKTHMYIADLYYIPFNLIIEVKDGGSSPNKNPSYAETRAKQMAKENWIIKKTEYNYLRLTDKDLSQLFNIFAELKLSLVENDTTRIIRVHESNLNNSFTDTIIFDFGSVLVHGTEDGTCDPDFLSTYEYTEDLLKYLKDNGYKLYYLSNWDKESFEKFKKQGVFDFIKYFDGGIVSYEVDAEKPATTIYKMLLDKYKIDPKSALFFDDKQENVEGFRAEGVSGIIFDKYTTVPLLMNLPKVSENKLTENVLKEQFQQSFIEGAILPQDDPGKCPECGSKRLGIYFYEKDRPVLLCKICGAEIKDLSNELYGLKENMYAAMQGFIPMGSQDTVIVNYMKKNSFTNEDDYAIAFDQKFDTIFARDESGILRKYNRDFLNECIYTPYLVAYNRESVKDFIRKNINTNQTKSALYEAVFGHKLYSDDQIMFEQNAKAYKDYYQVMIETANIFSESNTSIFKNIPKRWYIKSKDGAINCCIKLPDYEKPFRARSTMLILRYERNKWQCFFKEKDDVTADEYTFNAPGGGWNKGEDPIDAAIREAREEVRINVRDVKFMGEMIEYHDYVHDWVKENVPEKDWWYGYYSQIFVGMYESNYDGKIAKLDRDPFMLSGKWYNFDDIKSALTKEYKKAIEEYIKNANHAYYYY